MFDALIRAAIAAAGFTEADLNAMIRGAFVKINQIDARLARIERVLRIQNATTIENPDKTYGENDAA